MQRRMDTRNTLFLKRNGETFILLIFIHFCAFSLPFFLRNINHLIFYMSVHLMSPNIKHALLLVEKSPEVICFQHSFFFFFLLCFQRAFYLYTVYFSIWKNYIWNNITIYFALPFLYRDAKKNKPFLLHWTLSTKCF